MRTISKLTNKEYYPEKCCFILNVRQATLYIKHGVFPKELMLGRDDKMCFVFDRAETKDLFDKWCEHTLL